MDLSEPASQSGTVYGSTERMGRGEMPGYVSPLQRTHFMEASDAEVILTDVELYSSPR